MRYQYIAVGRMVVGGERWLAKGHGRGEGGELGESGGEWGRGEWVNTVGRLSSFLLNLYTLKCAKIRVRDTSRLFEDYRDFAHRVIKTPSR